MTTERVEPGAPVSPARGGLRSRGTAARSPLPKLPRGPAPAAAGEFDGPGLAVGTARSRASSPGCRGLPPIAAGDQSGTTRPTPSAATATA